MKRLSSHLFFIFLVLCLCAGSLLTICDADQTVLSYEAGKEDQPLIMDGQQIILQNDKEGSISWEEFKKGYTLVKINDTWVILEGSPEVFTLEEFKMTELQKLISAEQRAEIEKSVTEFDYKEDYNIEEHLKPITSYDKYFDLMVSPLILFLISGLIITICVGAWAGAEIAGLCLIIYMIIGFAIEIIPMWVLIVIVLGSSGIIAYMLSKGISGGAGE